jgi:alkylation response protein AidB-like acyl-CoA dehydrogenase
MPEYKAPLRDYKFLLDDVFDAKGHYEHLGAEDATPDMVEAILSEGAKFVEQVLSPLNQIGDQQGCRLEDGKVITPDGFKEAYQQYIENGWPSLSNPQEFGGQGLPESISTMISEMAGGANWSWGMYPGLSHGAKNTLELHGTDEQKETYLTKLVSGEWTGTMCLTESHAGSDLGLIKTRAEREDDGSFKITGTKIFISAGDHDMAENIVHICLAKIPGAPEGTKGISLFIVPKFLPDGTANGVSCGALEHKMGIHGNATCVMNFDGAKGFLIGPENGGLKCMFTFMNFARVATGLQGVAAAELSFQGALTYAQDRLAMRSLKGTQAPDKVADPIIVHPDVRRMLMTQKSIAEGGRAFLFYASKLVDIVQHGKSEEEVAEADAMLGVITPILKAFMTEAGYEAANLGVQVYGGHGFISEWGMEQIVRDTRIALLYEGTTGIQALDLIGRKVLKDRGKNLRLVTRDIHRFCRDHKGRSKEFTKPLDALNEEWGGLVKKIGFKAMKDRDEVGGASVDFLMYSGYVMLAFMWAKMADSALEKLSENPDDKDFYDAKIKTARFYFDRILPRVKAHKEMMLNGSSSMMDLDAEHFAF